MARQRVAKAPRQDKTRKHDALAAPAKQATSTKSVKHAMARPKQADKGTTSETIDAGRLRRLHLFFVIGFAIPLLSLAVHLARVWYGLAQMWPSMVAVAVLTTALWLVEFIKWRRVPRIVVNSKVKI